MGGGRSRSESRTATTYSSDQSYTDSSTTINNTLDGGAIKDAFEFASGALGSVDNATDSAMRVSLGALDYYDRINQNSLSVLESSTKNALDFASNASKGDGLLAAESANKNAVYLGLGGLALAYLVSRGK